MVGDGDVDDPSPVVREDDEHEQQPVGDPWHDEEIGSHDLADLVGQDSAMAVMVACLVAAWYFATVA